MKKFKKIIVASSLISLISFIACNEKDFLEQTPIGSVSEQALASKTGINGLLIGAYALLDGIDGRGSYWNGCSNYLYCGLASHEYVRGRTSNPGVGAFENGKLDAVNDNLPTKWEACYNGVQRANDVLRLFPKLPENELTDSEALQIKAEALFLRAVQHFELVRTWGNVPYIDETVVFNAGNYNVPNTTSIWPQIEVDFKFAADNLTETKPDPARPNKWAAKAFLAKTYMQQRKYSDALPLLTDCINNGVTANGQKYAMVNFYDNFDANKKNSAESVFAVQHVVNDNSLGANGNQSDLMFQPFVPQCSGGGGGHVTFDCVNTFKTDAVTGLPLFDTYNDFDIKHDQGLKDTDPFVPYTGTVDSRLDHTVGRRGIPLLDWGIMGVYWIFGQDQSGPYVPKKSFFYQADIEKTTESYEGWTTVNSDNYNMIRFADVLLLAAECEVEAGSLAKAEEYVNRVRARAANPTGWVKTYIDNNNPSLGFTNTPAANYKIGLYTGQFTAQGQAYARKAVHFERRLELALEGHRFFDMQRWDNGTGSLVDELNAIVEHEKGVGSSYAPNLQSFTPYVKGKSEIFPIPQAQIDLSVENGEAVLVQNPGY